MDQEMVDADTKQEGSSEESEALTNPLSIEDLKAVRTELLPLAGKWKDLGEVLELKPGKTDEIAVNNMYQAGPCLKDVLSEWLHGNGLRPTNWKTMLTCLRHPIMGKVNFADELKKKITSKAENDIC